MKIASVSCVARHPKGLDLHIRNLRWALKDVDHQIYIFTLAHWKHDKSEYPDVKFIETPGEPLAYREFWKLDIPPYLFANCSEDLFLLVEQDQWFTKPLKSLIDIAYNRQTIVLSDEQYGLSIRIDEQPVYPRIWEGGAILPRKYFIDPAIDHGVSYYKHIESDFICEKLKSCNKETIGNYKGRVSLNTIQKGDRWDTLGELCLYCYLMDVPVIQRNMLVHFHPTERVHRSFSDLYKSEVTQDAVNRAKRFNTSLHNALFMFYMGGVCELNSIVKSVWLEHADCLKGKIRQLSKANEWMSSEQLARLREVKKCLSLPVNMKML